MGAVFSTLTFPVRRPLVTAVLAGATLATSVHFFGPMATFDAIGKAAAGVSSAFSDAAKLVTDVHNAVTCPGVVAKANRPGGLTSELAPDVARCKDYFPSGTKEK
jgi:hypothetical protein